MHHALRSLPLALLTLASAAAFAADLPPKKEGSFGGAKGTGAYLTREQLRACLAGQDKSKDQDAEMLKEKGAIGAQKEEIERTDAELKLKLAGVDRTSADAVAAYNELAQARDRRVEAYQARVAAFNARIGEYQIERESFAQNCANRRYFDEDESAIRKGK
jgi:hypothetical protein